MKHHGHDKDLTVPSMHHSSAAARQEGTRGEFHPFTKPTESSSISQGQRTSSRQNPRHTVQTFKCPQKEFPRDREFRDVTT